MGHVFESLYLVKQDVQFRFRQPRPCIFAVGFQLAVTSGRDAVTAIKQFHTVEEPQSKEHYETVIVWGVSRVCGKRVGAR